MQENSYGSVKIAPLELLQQLHTNAAAVDIVVVNNMVVERNININFEGDVSLKMFFKDVDKIIEELRDNNISTSHSSLMATHLLQIEQ